MVEFREIKGFDGLYEAGSDGTVKVFKTKPTVLNGGIKNAGYYLE